MAYKKKHILIIDDDVEILNALKVLLEPKYKIMTISDSLKVMGALEDFLPDLVILDADLPLINGPNLCLRIKRIVKFKDIPIIFISAHTNGYFKKKSIEAGADVYVEKPFDYDKFIETIDSFIHPQSEKSPPKKSASQKMTDNK